MSGRVRADDEPRPGQEPPPTAVASDSPRDRDLVAAGDDAALAVAAEHHVSVRRDADPNLAGGVPEDERARRAADDRAPAPASPVAVCVLAVNPPLHGRPVARDSRDCPDDGRPSDAVEVANPPFRGRIDEAATRSRSEAVHEAVAERRGRAAGGFSGGGVGTGTAYEARR
ncbi:hypothetical protein ABY42_11495 [Haloferax gibbonsii]|uniref:Uncharacterized protein n=1 Tax=Haloferax gibbonsii TaxID=35746 RepID=A0A0K1IUV1_HALGI|nr:hypothetical protein ABY42_11495 [Haloferax gibbonsii]